MTRLNKLQIGSSETTREILYTQFYFENYIQFGTPQHKPNPNTIFLEWFIGFFEAEGCFLKWPDQKQKNRFGFEITQKDVQLMYKIRTGLGFGKVTEIIKKNNEIYWRYSVYDLKSLMRLILLFNGNLITVKKQKQFQIWVAELYKRYSTKQITSMPNIPFDILTPFVNISCVLPPDCPDIFDVIGGKDVKEERKKQRNVRSKELCFFPLHPKECQDQEENVRSITPSLLPPLTSQMLGKGAIYEYQGCKKKEMSDVIQRFVNGDVIFSKRKPEICFKNAWLSGFFEGDAGFWVKSKDIVRVNKDNSQSYNIKMKFYITQKGEKELLNQIKYLFQIPSDFYQITNGFSTEKYNRLETSLLKSHLLLIEYLTKYPFLGKRQILFNRWKRVLGYRINDYPITKKSIIKLQRLISNTK